MLNWIWLGLVLAGVVIAGATGRMKDVADGAIKGAETAVTLSLGLIGVMTVWMGIMRLAERSGFIHLLARVFRPLLRWLFPEVPHDHPAMGSMLMNIAANMIGLVNAATPLGLRAMRDLERLNPHPGTATNAMCTFLAINTGSVQLIPITAIGVLAAAGSVSPYAIVGTALLATCFSSAAGLIAVKLFEKLRVFAPVVQEGSQAQVVKEEEAVQLTPEKEPLSVPRRMVMALFLGFFAWAIYGMVQTGDVQATGFVRAVNAVSIAAIPFLLVFFPLFAALKRVKVYEELVEGGKEGFNVAIRIIPYLVMMLLAISMFRGGGGIELLTTWLRPVLDALRFPPELLPMALMRPLSGSGSLAIFSDLVKTLGPDNIITRMAGTIYGSTETTFYVIAVYFGAVGIQRTRHAIPAGLIADLAGIIASVIICRMMFG
ncbi:MAG TPA: nucleoside recognition domain-containing protein [Verrucomicrobiae bacterium]